MALLKPMYLATHNIEKKWTMPLQNWSITISAKYHFWRTQVEPDYLTHRRRGGALLC